MKIKDKIDYTSKPKPYSVKPTAKIMEALDVMCSKNFGSVLVVNDDQTIMGIVTERDMMRRVLHKGIDPKTTEIQTVMSTKVRAANENDELVDWLRIMSTERFRHLPIVDEHGKLINMMSQGDFVSHTWPDLFEHARAAVKEKVGLPFQFLMIAIAAAIFTLFYLQG